MGAITGNGTAVKGLGGAAGYGETALVRGDDTVTKVDVSAVFGAGFTLGGVNYAGQDLSYSSCCILGSRNDACGYSAS